MRYIDFSAVSCTVHLYSKHNIKTIANKSVNVFLTKCVGGKVFLQAVLSQLSLIHHTPCIIYLYMNNKQYHLYTVIYRPSLIYWSSIHRWTNTQKHPEQTYKHIHIVALSEWTGKLPQCSGTRHIHNVHMNVLEKSVQDYLSFSSYHDKGPLPSNIWNEQELIKIHNSLFSYHIANYWQHK